LYFVRLPLTRKFGVFVIFRAFSRALCLSCSMLSVAFAQWARRYKLQIDPTRASASKDTEMSSRTAGTMYIGNVLRFVMQPAA
jgi:hypothetical protein